jgi:SAM-dependent methyltransferase
MDIAANGFACGTTLRHTSPCRICGAPLKHSVLDLGMSPLCESFLTSEELDQAEHYYPLHIYLCSECLLVQLREYVSPQHIFEQYAYFSSYSTSWVNHAAEYCQRITERLRLNAASLAVELASNDGYLLQHFARYGVPVLGIEPAANVAEVAIAKNIPTLVEFFGRKLADRLVSEGRQADLIIGNNVLAQVPDLNDFVAGMQRLLKPEGLITLEFPHVLHLVRENQFDTIYHEHFSYFSLATIERLAERHALRLVDVDELRTHGGSLRVYLAHAASGYDVSVRVPALLAVERQLGFDELRGYATFAEQVRHTKRRLLSFLIEAKESGKTICGYGAPGKGNTLLNYCGIGTDFLDFTVDRNPYKHGRFTPGMHIPIYPTEMIDQVKPDYILILPWNLKDEIIAQMRHVAAWGAKFIIPIPAAHVVDPKESA